MKSDPDEIHFDCPKCKRPMSGDKALLGEMINCPDCGEPFFPTPHATATAQFSPEAIAAAAKLNESQLAALRLPSVQNDSNAALVRMELTKRVKSIRSRAETCTQAGIGCSVCAGVFLLMCPLILFSGGNEGTSFIEVIAAAASAFIGLSLWFFLIAQIMHVRANTEK